MSLLDLTFVICSKDDDEELKMPLASLLECLPSTSDEYLNTNAGTSIGSNNDKTHVSVAGTTYANYIRLFQKLCQLLESSGSKSIFTSLISVYCREENHPMKTSLVLCLRNVQAKLDLLDMAYEYTLGAKGKGPKLSNVEPS